MANTLIKRCPTWFTVRELHIKTRYVAWDMWLLECLKLNNSQYQMLIRGSPLLGEKAKCYIHFQKTAVCYKVKHRLMINPAMMPLGIRLVQKRLEFKRLKTIAKTAITFAPTKYLRNWFKRCVHPKACTQVFTAALLIITPNWKQPRCSSND